MNAATNNQKNLHINLAWIKRENPGILTTTKQKLREREERKQNK